MREKRGSSEISTSSRTGWYDLAQTLGQSAHIQPTGYRCTARIVCHPPTAEVKNFDEPPPDSQLIWIEIPITNNGRTPARITKIIVTPKLVPFPESGWGRPGELPKVPEYDDAARVITLQGQDIIIAPTDTLGHMHVYIWPPELERIRARKDSLYVYGSIEYLDTVRNLPHKTCFCSIDWIPQRGFNEPTEFMFSQMIPAAYFCAT